MIELKLIDKRKTMILILYFVKYMNRKENSDPLGVSLFVINNL